MAKEIPYFIEQGSKERPTREIVRDMRQCSIIIVLGDYKTSQMEREEIIARALEKPVWYRPHFRTVEELMEKSGKIFPNHFRRKRMA